MPPSLTGTVDRAGDVVFVGAVAAWVVLLALILRHRVFVSHDSMSNYAHVWYVSDRLRRAHLIPFHMPVVGHGQAYAFPYAFVPWLMAAVLWLVLGEWAVTFWIACTTTGSRGSIGDPPGTMRCLLSVMN